MGPMNSSDRHMVRAKGKSSLPQAALPRHVARGNFGIDQSAPLISRKVIEISASPERVWEVMAAVNQWPDWNSTVSWVNSAGPLRVGSIFKWKSGGLRITSTVRLFELNHAIGWTGGAMGAFASHAWYLEETSSGVRVITEESMSGWLIRLFKPIVRMILSSSLQRWLFDLKKESEKFSR